MTETRKFGHIIANSRPRGTELYLDGEHVLDSSGQIAKTPTMIMNVPEGVHNITFSKLGFDDTTIMVIVRKGLYSDARAILNTQFMRYPMMLSTSKERSLQPLQPLQPSPGWPALPIPQIPYGHIVVNTIPDGAEVYIDGQPIFDSVGRVVTTPTTILDIVTGIHKVTFRKTGYFDENIDVLIQNGLYSDVSAALRLRMAPMQQTIHKKGDITIDTNPSGAYIYIDSVLLVDKLDNPITTPVTLTLNEGWHDLVIHKEKYCREFGPIYVYANKHLKIHKDLDIPPCS
jgi:hypothetical protein